MFGIHEGGLEGLQNDPDEAEIQRMVGELLGETVQPKARMTELRETAAMALYHGRRMGLTGPDAYDAMAALCLVLGDNRRGFFENIFVRRMLSNRNLTPREKLHRLIEIIIGSARPQRAAPTLMAVGGA